MGKLDRLRGDLRHDPHCRLREPVPAAAATATDEGDGLRLQLRNLAWLHDDAGFLSDEEYAQERGLVTLP